MTKRREPVVPALIVIGLVGVYFDYITPEGNRCSCSGCGDLDYFLRRLTEGHYRSTRIDLHASVVLDKRRPLEAHPGFAYASPMVDLCLQPGDVSRFADLARGSFLADALRNDLVGENNAFAALVRGADEAEKIGVPHGPLDEVDVERYCRWWRTRGARTGVLLRDGTEYRVTWHEPVTVGRDTGSETPFLDWAEGGGHGDVLS